MPNPAVRRNSYRLPGYDYAQPGAYFLTLCAHRRASIFGTVVKGQVQLSVCGQIVRAEWLRSSKVRAELALDCFVVMPNHFHALVQVVAVLAVQGPDLTVWPLRPPRAVGSLVAGFKAAVTRSVHARGWMVDQPVWQRNYYDHIVRDRADYERIQEYILTNPAKWEQDRFYR